MFTMYKRLSLKNYCRKTGRIKINLCLPVFICIGIALIVSSCSPKLRGKLKADVIAFSSDATTSYAAGKGVLKNFRKQSMPY